MREIELQKWWHLFVSKIRRQQRTVFGENMFICNEYSRPRLRPYCVGSQMSSWQHRIGSTSHFPAQQKFGELCLLKNLCFWRLPWKMTRLCWLIDDVQTYCDWFQVHSVPSLHHHSLKHQLTKFFLHVIKFISKMAAYILSRVISWCIFRRLSFVWATNDTAKNKQRFTTLNLVLKNQSAVQ